MLECLPEMEDPLSIHLKRLGVGLIFIGIPFAAFFIKVFAFIVLGLIILGLVYFLGALILDLWD